MWISLWGEKHDRSIDLSIDLSTYLSSHPHIQWCECRGHHQTPFQVVPHATMPCLSEPAPSRWKLRDQRAGKDGCRTVILISVSASYLVWKPHHECTLMVLTGQPSWFPGAYCTIVTFITSFSILKYEIFRNLFFNTKKLPAHLWATPHSWILYSSSKTIKTKRLCIINFLTASHLQPWSLILSRCHSEEHVWTLQMTFAFFGICKYFSQYLNALRVRHSHMGRILHSSWARVTACMEVLSMFFLCQSGFLLDSSWVSWHLPDPGQFVIKYY